jgi:excisionase family DNA binding protein
MNYLSTKQAAERLGISVQAVQRMCIRGEIRAWKDCDEYEATWQISEDYLPAPALIRALRRTASPSRKTRP